MNDKTLSYHDVVVYVDGIEYKIFDRPYSLRLTCTRCGGWELWDVGAPEPNQLLGGEYSGKPFMIRVKDIVICDNSYQFE